MAKKKQKSKANSSFAKTLKIIFLFLLLFGIGLLVYLNIYESKEQISETKEIKTQKEIQKPKPQTIVNAINNYKNEKSIDKEKNLNQNFSDIFANMDLEKNDDNCKVTSVTCFDTKETSAFGSLASATNIKAKLAIIIDDVATKEQSEEIKKIIKNGKKITPSFFPNTNNHPDTNKYSKEFKSFMIHLPLRALKFNKEEPLTLTPNDSYQVIENRIKNIKIAFPNLKYLNNHTGSLFSEDENAMRNLFKALKKYDLIFVDSRTSANTKAPTIAKEFNQFYIHRNVFLDNSQDLNDIRKKLDEAVEFALKHKRAIAIAHPHKNSLKAISEYNFSKVELVYIDDIYNDYK
ncbi:divergent polysaccharide deacetylase family protein [Campylobacter sp. RM12654]|uniref:divergent polysaccharide deacetylase family protein n=1 Tax=Campylobacter sp. RM12654 TaxID=2735738 RepID=UPI00301491F2|nr:divergent polysaccharide deacetylase family protein [Campylobacter sp. RM12654]